MAFIELRAHDPHMLIWVEIIVYHGGGRYRVKYETNFFRWLHDHLLMIEDYIYVGTNFQGDPYLASSVDEQWGDLGE